MMNPARKKKLGELLVEAKIITPDQLTAALRKQKETGWRLGEILEVMGLVTRDQLSEFLGVQLGIPHVWLRQGLIDPQQISLIPKAKAQLYQVIPMFKVKNTLTVAMADASALYVMNDLEKITGCRIQPVVCRNEDIQTFIEQYYNEKGGMATLIESLEKSDVQVIEDLMAKDLEELQQEAEGSPIINLVNRAIMDAIRGRASDIHIEIDKEKLRVRYRIDGILHEMMSTKKDLHPGIVSRVKVMARMDIAERRMPQEGRIHVRAEGQEVDLRVSSMPTISGEKIVIRLLDRKNAILDLHCLSFPPRILEIFKHMLYCTHGLVLVTGPTGSGKTTTLYAALNFLLTLEKNFVTIEDPVEYQLEIVNQIQVNERIGLSFAKILRSVLRQDPDIIMVGEIRDRETAEVAIQAALTGHLVLSTLHTNDSSGAITRLLEMGIEPYLISSALIGVLAQRLVRQICEDCKTTYIPSTALLEKVGWTGKRHVTFVRGKGCNKCYDSGFKGRTGIYELLEVTEEMRGLILKNPPLDEIRKVREKSGLRTLKEEGFELVKAGLTTPEEVSRVINVGSGEYSETNDRGGFKTDSDSPREG
jgi:type IV pilus assembly protein PilB